MKRGMKPVCPISRTPHCPRTVRHDCPTDRVARLVVPEYPATHNPYLVHERLPDCYPGCKIAGGAK